MKKTVKKCLATILSLTMMVPMCTFASAASADLNNSEEAVGNTYTGQIGPGSYSISTATQLRELARVVNAGNDYAGSTFTLEGNINLGNAEWSPIGNGSVSLNSSTGSPQVSGNGFAGTLDGNGYTISGLSITSAESGSGFIGSLESSGTLENLKIGGSINISSTNETNAVGAAVGYNSGTIRNVINRASVTVVNGSNVGGIAGFNNGYYGDSPVGLIDQCGNEGSVSGYSKIGGITGENSGTITECYNYGTITNISGRKAGTGGITGRNGNNNTAVENGVITNCYNRGYVNNNNGHWGGGIAGFQNSLSEISNCYVTADTDHCSWSNPIVGKNESNLNRNNYSKQGLHTSGTDIDSIGSNPEAEMQSQAFTNQLATEGTPAGWSYSVSVNNALPYFSWQTGNYVPVETNATDGISGISSEPDLTGMQNSIVIDSRFTETGRDSEGNTRYNNLSDLLSQVESGTVYVTGPVVIPEGTSAAISNNLSFVRYNTYTDGYLFEVNGTLSMQAGTISGNNLQCNAQVIVNTGGTFNLSGGTVTNAAGIYRPGAGVYVCGGTFNMSGGALSGLSSIGQNTKANAVVLEKGVFVLSGGTISCSEGEIAVYNNDRFELNLESAASVNGIVYFGNTQRIICGESLTLLSGVLTIEMENESTGRIVAVGVSSSQDAAKIEYYNDECSLSYDADERNIRISSVNTLSDQPDLDLLSNDMDLLEIDYSQKTVITEDTAIPAGTTIGNYLTINGGTAEDPITVTIDGNVTCGTTKAITYPIFVNTNSYAEIVGINNATIRCTSVYQNMIMMTGAYLKISGVTLDANGKLSGDDSVITVMSGITCDMVFDKGARIINSSGMNAGGLIFRYGNLAIDDAEFSDLTCSNTSGAEAIRNYNGTVIIKKGIIKGKSDSISDIKGTNAPCTGIIKPTGNIQIGQMTEAAGITLIPQNGASISSYRLVQSDNTEITTVPTEETSLGTAFNLLELEASEASESPTQTYGAYLANASAEEIAKDGTFTADVYVKSDSQIDAAQIDLTVQNGTITSIEPAADGIESGNGSISVYNNTADVKDGYKLATVTVKADGSKNDVVLSIADTSTVGISGSPEDYSFTLGDDAQATVSIYKSDKVSCEEYAAGKYLLKYTGEVADGNIAQYNGEDMLYSEKLGAWIAVIDTDVSESVVNNDITTAAGTKESVDYTGDVNINGIVNIVDAQIAYDIANNIYSDYSIATKPMWFRADVNGDGTVKASDARAIQCLIHGIVS